MRNLLLCSFLFLYSAQAITFLDVVLEEWETWKMTHVKKYESHIEEKFRLKIFMENKAKVERHNRRAQQGKHTYFLQINKYGDLLHYEFRTMLNGYKQRTKNQTRKYEAGTFIRNAHVDRLPAKVDWRKLGAVTPVKDQVTNKKKSHKEMILSISGTMWILLVFLHNGSFGSNALQEDWEAGEPE